MKLLARFTHLFVLLTRILAGTGILSMGYVTIMVATHFSDDFPWLFRLVLTSVYSVVGVYLAFYLKRSKKPIHPESIRECTALVAFISFVIITTKWRDYPIVDMHPDHKEWATLILAIALFSIHRTASYWMIRSVFPKQKNKAKDPGTQSTTELPRPFSPPKTTRTVM